MAYETIIVEIKDGVGKITFNRPEVLNAYNQTVSHELRRAFEELAADKNVRVIVFTGAGRAFMAGADINMVNNWAALKDSKAIQKGITDPKLLNLALFEACPKPVIAAINGLAFGMGCELLMACDFRIAVESAKFGQPEIKIGVIPGGGGTQRLTRLVGKTKSLEMNLIGEPITAEEGLRYGLLTRVVPDGKLWEEVEVFTKRLINLSAESLGLCKQAVLQGISMPLNDGIALEQELFSKVLLTDDAQEGTKAFLEKRKPRFNQK